MESSVFPTLFPSGLDSHNPIPIDYRDIPDSGQMGNYWITGKGRLFLSLLAQTQVAGKLSAPAVRAVQGDCQWWILPFVTQAHNTLQTEAILTPPCVAESDQRHAQHPLKMLGIDFSCGSYQTNSERIMLLNSWYQIDMSLYSNRYLFVRSKIGGQKWQPHILCKTMSFFASRLTPWFAWQPRAPAQKTTRADMQILYSLLSQYLCVLNNVRGRYEKCIVPGNKDFWIQ